MQGQDSSNKDFLNIFKDKNLRKRNKPNIKNNNKTVKIP